MADYTMRYDVDATFEETVEATTDALAEEGFGVLCDIDVQATLREKLDAEFRRYRILGACNPPLARDGLTAELELGALLPCNVVVFERDGGGVAVSAVDPRVLLSVVDNDALDPIAESVAESLETVLEKLPGAEPAAE